MTDKLTYSDMYLTTHKPFSLVVLRQDNSAYRMEIPDVLAIHDPVGGVLSIRMSPDGEIMLTLRPDRYAEVIQGVGALADLVYVKVVLMP